MTEPRSGTLLLFCCHRFTKGKAVSSLPARGRGQQRLKACWGAVGVCARGTQCAGKAVDGADRGGRVAGDHPSQALGFEGPLPPVRATAYPHGLRTRLSKRTPRASQIHEGQEPAF